MEKLCSSVEHLTDQQKNILKEWSKRLPSEFFLRIVNLFQSYIAFAVSMSIDSQQVAAVHILELLCILFIRNFSSLVSP
jgi:hypothetical protein